MLTKENVTALQNSFDGVRCAHFRCRFGKVIFCLLFSYFCCCCFCRSWTYSLYFCSLVFRCYRYKHVAGRDLYTRDMQYTLSLTTESYTFLVALLSLRSVASSFWFSDSFFYYFVTSYTFCSFLVRMNPRFSLFVLCLILSFPLRWTLILFLALWTHIGLLWMNEVKRNEFK